MKTIFKVFSADVFAKLIAMLTTILLIRFMSTHNYADYVIFIAVSNFFSQTAISSFGKMFIVDYKILKGRETTLLLIQICLALIVTFVFCLIQPIVRTNISGLLFLMIATCFFGYGRIVFQQQCKFRLYSFIEIIRVFVFFVLLIIWYLGLKNEITSTAVVMFYAFSLICFIPLLKKKYTEIDWLQVIKFKEVLRIIFGHDQIYLFVYTALVAALTQIDVLALKTWGTDYHVATYASALKYYGMLLLLLYTIQNILLPKISLEEDYEKIKKMYQQIDVLSMFLIVGISFAFILAPILLPFIDGGKYPGSVSVFRILCISAVISFWSSPYNSFLIKEKKYFSTCIRFSIGVFIALIGNYILIPHYNVIGTALITLLSFGFSNLTSRIHAQKIINEKNAGIKK